MNFGIGFSFFDRAFPFFFSVIFTLVIGGFIYVIGSNILQFVKNQKSPEMVVEAKVLTKRIDVHSHRGHHHRPGHIHSTGHTYTRYYVTFQLEDGSRKEFQVTSKDYGYIVEGDLGRLFFRGTRYQGFDRI